MSYLKLLFLFFLLATITFTQSDDLDDDFDQDPEDDLLSQEEVPLTSSSPQEQQEQQRQIIISCIILTQHYGAGAEQQFKEVIDSHGQDQQTKMKVYNKIIGKLLDTCYIGMQIEQAQKMLSELRQNTFKVEMYQDVYNKFKWEDYAMAAGKTVDLELTEQEKNLLNFKEEFEKAMKDRQQKDEDKEDDFKKITPDDYEPKIAGLSMKNAPKSLQMFYLFGVFAIAAVVLVLGLKYLQQEHKLPGDKKSKKRAKKE